MKRLLSLLYQPYSSVLYPDMALVHHILDVRQEAANQAENNLLNKIKDKYAGKTIYAYGVLFMPDRCRGGLDRLVNDDFPSLRVVAPTFTQCVIDMKAHIIAYEKNGPSMWSKIEDALESTSQQEGGSSLIKEGQNTILLIEENPYGGLECHAILSLTGDNFCERVKKALSEAGKK